MWRWRSRCWHLALERLTNYTGVLAGVSTAVFCSRGDLADRPEEKRDGSGGEVYWLCGAIKFYILYQTAFLNQCALCVVYCTGFHSCLTLEAQIPNFASDQLSDILHGFLLYLLRILVYFKAATTSVFEASRFIVDYNRLCCCCYHHHHHKQQQQQHMQLRRRPAIPQCNHAIRFLCHLLRTLL